jgi:glucose-1-phosphate thymidylyltransferase
MAEIPLDVIGLLPCGGQATRLAPLPLSKELYPIGFQGGRDGTPRPKAVAQYLLEKMRHAGITKAYCILRPGKWDIPAYFGDGERLDMHLGYLILRSTAGVPYTLDQAYPFVGKALVALGFPDILLQPEDCYTQIIARQRRTQADVVLGLFPCDRPHKAGMVEFDTNGVVQRIIEKPQQTSLKFMWGIAVWNSTFTEFLHRYVINLDQAALTAPSAKEVPIGDVIQAAISAGLQVEAEPFPNGSYLDIGTPEDLQRAVRQGVQEESDGYP